MQNIIAALLLTLLISNSCFCQHKKLNIVVDERIELMTVIEQLCTVNVVTKTSANLSYQKEIKTAFSSFQNHPLITLFDSIYYKFFNFEMPPQVMLHYNLPQFTLRYPMNATDFSPVREYDKHKDVIELFCKHLKDFYQKSKFHEFFTSHHSFYDSLVNDMTNTLRGKNIIPEFESYFGTSFNSYTLILCPLYLDGGFSVKLTKKGKTDIYGIIGPKQSSIHYPLFNKNNTLIIHELAHPFSNPVIEKAYSEFEKDTCLYRLIKTDMKKEGYQGWKAVLIETFNRANEIELTRQVYGESEADSLLSAYKEKKYIYLDVIIPVLKIYKNNRSKYPTINTIATLLINEFKKEKELMCK